MIIWEGEQGSEEWLKARLGIPTASEFDKIMTTKGAISTQRQKLIYRLAGERLTGIVPTNYASAAMQRGTELEPEARAFFELITGHRVDLVGLCYKDEKRDTGCSPDGLIGEDEGVEIKCPNVETHIEYMVKGVLPTAYLQQVQGSLFVTGRKRWHFFSYYPSMKPFHLIVERDELWIAQFSKILADFNKELDETYKQLKGGK